LAKDQVSRKTAAVKEDLKAKQEKREKSLVMGLLMLTSSRFFLKLQI
jgi:hypothetical protein